MRGVIAIVAGAVVGLLIMICLAVLGGLIFPGSAQVSAISAEQVAAAFPDLPAGAKAAIILAWFGGTLAGALVAKRIARRGWAAWTIGGIFAVYVLLNVLILPMPGWMQAVAILAPLLGGLIANHLVADRPDADATAD